MSWAAYFFQFGWISMIGTVTYWVFLTKARKSVWNRFIFLEIRIGSLVLPIIRVESLAPWESGKIEETAVYFTEGRLETSSFGPWFRQWRLRFEPAQKDGEPVKFWVNVPFVFAFK